MQESEWKVCFLDLHTWTFSRVATFFHFFLNIFSVLRTFWHRFHHLRITFTFPGFATSLTGINLHEKLHMMWPYADTISITQHNGFVTEGAGGHAAVIWGKGLETKKMTTSVHLHTFLYWFLHGQLPLRQSLKILSLQVQRCKL